MNIGDIYGAAFDPEKQLWFRSKEVDEEGNAITSKSNLYSEWIRIEKDDPLINFIGGAVPSGTDIMNGNQFKIEDVKSHDGEVVDLHGRKYLLTEVKDI